MKSTKVISLALLTMVSLALISPLNVQAKDIQQTIKERKQGFKTLGKSMRALGKQLKSGNTDIAQAKEIFTTMQLQSTKIPAWFELKSSTESGFETEALPAIWKNKADFLGKAQALNKATTDILANIDSSDFELKSALMQVKRTCGSCHKKYKLD